MKAGIYRPGIQVDDLSDDLFGLRLEPTDLIYILCNLDRTAWLPRMLAGENIVRKPFSLAVFVKEQVVHHCRRRALHAFVLVYLPEGVITVAHDFTGQWPDR